MGYPRYRDVQRPERIVEVEVSWPDYVYCRAVATGAPERWTREEFLLRFEAVQ